MSNKPDIRVTCIPDTELHEEVRKLRRIVAKLPKTADGVPLVPGLKVWPEPFLNMLKPVSGTVAGIWGKECNVNGSWRENSRIYSTRAALNAAMKKK